MENKLLRTPWGEDEIEAVRAVTIGVITRDTDEITVNISLDELDRLIETAGGRTFARLTQSRDFPEAATVLGKGKLQELAELCRVNGVELVVFDCELTPSQIRNIEDALSSDDSDVMVIDRAMLILDIFALHAVSGEGKLQVELAQLRYTAPRLIGKGLALSRQGGGNIAMRGPGETKLETDRRHIERRIRYLQQQLEKLAASRATKRKARDRAGITGVAIVGYTNAGKSTLLNYLTGAGILAEDKLFATLDPTTRRFRLPCGEEILLTDTVGFIRNLPHQLVEAFKSTLDELTYADIIIALIDASDPESRSQLEVTRSLINDLGASDKPVLYVWNKCDLPSDGLAPVVWENGSPVDSRDVICVSALTGQGTDKLISRLEELVLQGRRNVRYLIPNSRAGELSRMYELASIINVEYGENGITVDAVCDARARGIFAEFAADKSDIGGIDGEKE